MPYEKGENEKYITTVIDKPTWRIFRAAVILNDMTVKEALFEAILNWIKKNEK